MTDDLRLQESVWANESNAEHYWQAHSHRSKWFAERIPAGIKSVFEVGCSSGRNLKFILERHPHLKVGGIDINASSIESARARIPNGNFIVGSIYDNSWVEEKYDMIFTSGVMLHIIPSKIDDVINKILRKAKLYISHMETNGTNKILNWHAESRPSDKITSKLCWEPNIMDIYHQKGVKAEIQNIPCGETDAKHHIYINLKGKQEGGPNHYEENVDKIFGWLDKIAFRCSSSDAGPWVVKEDTDGHFGVFIDNGRFDKKICTVYDRENATFIANSANDVRLLVHSARTLIKYNQMNSK